MDPIFSTNFWRKSSDLLQWAAGFQGIKATIGKDLAKNTPGSMWENNNNNIYIGGSQEKHRVNWVNNEKQH